jgi:hypothetical protein
MLLSQRSQSDEGLGYSEDQKSIDGESGEEEQI